ncbi:MULTISPECIES: IS66 family insertion sequence element accessory protein TnpA [Alteromonas]|jgi:hypothetical protein|uniref:IS66 family insertion sequence element accessory protein TnpA n=1 Tax=Alteromonas TaxID=226 RepID=UPI000028772F|nr:MULTISPECIES: hypothetical protein [Alteromonas]AFV85986.1 hypothetical protein amad1_12430 [Alteromonas mediterranea DE1]AGP97997.1 hypothetical protein I635_12410 [Alteromonas mediterranea UM7]AGQ02256.1 hypothetical protein I636_12045 [Alteromonas mediterranea UM4b]|tara:strand:+ start:167 stop:472 length:306 start_codon:yes stop_codon:yes gene_type:complete
MTSSERRQHWQNIINQQVDSGLSKAAFCREQGILQQTFFYWAKKLKSPDTPQLILPVAITQHSAPSPNAQLEVELPCQTVLRFNESVPPSLLGQYLAVLKA